MFNNPDPHGTRNRTIDANNNFLREAVPVINDYIERPELGGNITVDLISLLLKHYDIMEVLRCIQTMQSDLDLMNCPTASCRGHAEIQAETHDFGMTSFGVVCKDCNTKYSILGENIISQDLK